MLLLVELLLLLLVKMGGESAWLCGTLRGREVLLRLDCVLVTGSLKLAGEAFETVREV